jgi:hypothetical protein
MAKTTIATVWLIMALAPMLTACRQTELGTYVRVAHVFVDRCVTARA